MVKGRRDRWRRKTEEAREMGRGRKRGKGRVGKEREGEKHTAGQAQG